MPLSRALVQPFRKSMLLVGAGWRAAFAPWDYSAQANASLTDIGTAGAKILDLGAQGPFDVANLPTGWTDCGWIKELKVTPQSKIGQVRSGYRGAVRVQYRGEVGLQFDFKFRESGRLQMKLASGTSVFNLLGNPTPSTTGPLSTGGSPTPAVALGGSGYVASGAVVGYVGRPTLYVPGGSGAQFAPAAGAPIYIVCDKDMSAGTQAVGGLVGDNGTFVFPAVVSDIDYIRKTSDYVARVVAVVAGAQDALVLDQPFIGGGSPNATASPNSSNPVFTPGSATGKVQKIVGWSAREGGSFIQEWSGLFVTTTLDGAQIALYFPHVSINQFREFTDWTIENAGTTDLIGSQLESMFECLAFDDPVDGETVVGYSAFYPSARTQNTY